MQTVFKDYSLFDFFSLIEDPILSLMFSQVDSDFALPGRILHKGYCSLIVSHPETHNLSAPDW